MAAVLALENNLSLVAWALTTGPLLVVVVIQDAQDLGFESHEGIRDVGVIKPSTLSRPLVCDLSRLMGIDNGLAASRRSFSSLLLSSLELSDTAIYEP